MKNLRMTPFHTNGYASVYRVAPIHRSSIKNEPPGNPNGTLAKMLKEAPDKRVDQPINFLLRNVHSYGNSNNSYSLTQKAAIRNRSTSDCSTPRSGTTVKDPVNHPPKLRLAHSLTKGTTNDSMKGGEHNLRATPCLGESMWLTHTSIDHLTRNNNSKFSNDTVAVEQKRLSSAPVSKYPRHTANTCDSPSNSHLSFSWRNPWPPSNGPASGNICLDHLSQGHSNNTTSTKSSPLKDSVISSKSSSRSGRKHKEKERKSSGTTNRDTSSERIKAANTHVRGFSTNNQNLARRDNYDISVEELRSGELPYRIQINSGAIPNKSIEPMKPQSTDKGGMKKVLCAPDGTPPLPPVSSVAAAPAVPPTRYNNDSSHLLYPPVAHKGKKKTASHSSYNRISFQQHLDKYQQQQKALRQTSYDYVQSAQKEFNRNVKLKLDEVTQHNATHTHPYPLSYNATTNSHRHQSNNDHTSRRAKYPTASESSNLFVNNRPQSVSSTAKHSNSTRTSSTNNDSTSGYSKKSKFSNASKTYSSPGIQSSKLYGLNESITWERLNTPWAVTEAAKQHQLKQQNRTKMDTPNRSDAAEVLIDNHAAEMRRRVTDNGTVNRSVLVSTQQHNGAPRVAAYRHVDRPVQRQQVPDKSTSLLQNEFYEVPKRHVSTGYNGTADRPTVMYGKPVRCRVGHSDSSPRRSAVAGGSNATACTSVASSDGSKLQHHLKYSPTPMAVGSTGYVPMPPQQSPNVGQDLKRNFTGTNGKWYHTGLCNVNTITSHSPAPSESDSLSSSLFTYYVSGSNTGATVEKHESNNPLCSLLDVWSLSFRQQNLADTLCAKDHTSRKKVAFSMGGGNDKTNCTGMDTSSIATGNGNGTGNSNYMRGVSADDGYRRQRSDAESTSAVRAVSSGTGVHPGMDKLSAPLPHDHRKLTSSKSNKYNAHHKNTSGTGSSYSSAVAVNSCECQDTVKPFTRASPTVQGSNNISTGTSAGTSRYTPFSNWCDDKRHTSSNDAFIEETNSQHAIVKEYSRLHSTPMYSALI
eukprot:Lankesteria_metandrocarpae@DN567_c0_g1_i1.p1